MHIFFFLLQKIGVLIYNKVRLASHYFKYLLKDSFLHVVSGFDWRELMN